MSAREEILGRVRRALADAPGEVTVDWAYARPVAVDGLLETFVERVADYRAVVEMCTRGELAGQVRVALDRYGARRVVVPSGLVAEVEAGLDGLTVLDEDSAASAAELDQVDAVVTAAAVGIADTGTLVLDHRPDQGPRQLTLVPDVHVCVIDAARVVSGVPEALARLGEAGEDRRPLTFISGPSATSDIELDRVEGVHGPRTLHVIVTAAGR